MVQVVHYLLDARGREPRREVRRLGPAMNGRDAAGGDAVLVHQDAHVFVSRLNAGARVEHALGDGRGVYLYVIEGDARVNGEQVNTGAAAQITDERLIAIAAAAATELILVDVAVS